MAPSCCCLEHLLSWHPHSFYKRDLKNHLQNLYVVSTTRYSQTHGQIPFLIVFDTLPLVNSLPPNDQGD